MGESQTQDALFRAYAGLVHGRFTSGVEAHAAYMRKHPRKPGESRPDPMEKSGENWAFQQLPYVKPSLFDQLKDEFGENPGYWQLCFWNASHWRENQELGIRHFNPEPFQYLTKSLEMGLHDPATYLLLQPVFETAAEKFLEDGANLLCGQIEFSDPGRTAAAKEIAGEEVAALHALAKDLVSEIGLSELEMLDKVVELAPESSGSWYSRGTYLATHGELDKGLSDIRNGNKAPENNNLIGIPFIAWISLYCGSSDPVLAVVLGMLSVFGKMEITCGSQRLLMGYHLRETLKTLDSGRDKIAMINAWTKMVFRSAQAEPCDESTCMLAVNMAARYFIRVTENFSKQYSKANRKLIRHTCAEALNEVNNSMRHRSLNIGDIEDDPVDEGSGLLSDEQMLEYLSKLYLSCFEREKREKEKLTTIWVPLIHSLEEIDLEELMEP